MNNDDMFLNSLADFRDVKVKYDSDNSVNHLNNQSQTCQNLAQLQFNSNEKLIKSFKELRQQLKQSNKNSQKLRSKLNERQSQIERLKLSEKEYIAQNYQLKSQIEHYKQSNQDSKAKLIYLKESAKGASKMQQELQFLKIQIFDYKSKLEKMTQENKKILQVSVLQKIQLQEKINHMQAKQNSDLSYVQDMQIQLSKQRQKTLKLQNQLRKTQIKYDEELYSKKWLGGNFQKQQLQEQVSQLQKQLQQMSTKTKKQKEKRNMLQKRVIQLQQMTGLWTVKAQTYQIQNKNILKKCKKMQKKMTSLKDTADNQTSQSLGWQQKFLKIVSISQELISRVKRQLYGDAVTLAKSCQYKINKLKQQQKQFIKLQQNRKSPSISKIRSKSRTYSKQVHCHSPISDEKHTPGKGILIQQDLNDYSKTKPKFYGKYEQNPLTFANSNKDNDRFSEKRSNNSNNNSDRFSEKRLTELSSSTNPLSDVENLDLKIRREREQMERKIRQKMLYRKIQVASSPDRHRLRQQYLNYVEL